MKKIGILLAQGFLLGTSFAGTMGVLVEPSWMGVLELGVGPAWFSSNDVKNVTLSNDPYIYKSYTVSQTGVPVLGEIFLGVENLSINPWFVPSVGISFLATNKESLKGNICDFGDCTNFGNQCYTASVSYQALAFKAKARLKKSLLWEIEPFVSGSIGSSRIRATEFATCTQACGVVADPNFRSNTNHDTFYSVSLGLQKKVSDSMSLALSGTYASPGDYEFGTFPGQATASLLSAHQNIVAATASLILEFDAPALLAPKIAG